MLTRIHTQVGDKCLGVKVNNKLEPISYQLKSGDQVEVLTSDKQYPKTEWLNFVKTHRAKSRIKASLREKQKEIAKEGIDLLAKEMKRLKISHEDLSLRALQAHFKVSSALDLHYKIATGEIKLKGLKDLEVKKGELHPKVTIQKRMQSYFGQKNTTEKADAKNNVLVFGSNMEKLDYKFATCCHPIAGDEVFGFITVSEGVKVHKTSCPNAVQLMSNYAYRIMKAQWVDENNIDFLTGLKIIGFDDKGMVNNITQVVSNELNVNMRSLNFDSHDGVFEGVIMVLVQDTSHLKSLMTKLKKVSGVKKIERISKK